MTILAQMSLEELEAKVRERMDLVQKIVDFAQAITRERGKLVKREVGSWNTHEERELKHFGGFSFQCSSGHGMMGGNNVEVWHNPEAQSVFLVYYQVSIEGCDVITFRDSEDWLPALLYLMEHKDEVIAEIIRKEEEERERRRELAEASQKRTKLLEQALKLRL